MKTIYSELLYAYFEIIIEKYSRNLKSILKLKIFLTAGIEHIDPFRKPSFRSLENAIKILDKVFAIENITSGVGLFSSKRKAFHTIDKYFLSLSSLYNFVS